MHRQLLFNTMSIYVSWYIRLLCCFEESCFLLFSENADGKVIDKTMGLLFKPILKIGVLLNVNVPQYFMALPRVSRAYWIWNKPLGGEMGGHNGEYDSLGRIEASQVPWQYLFIIYTAFSRSVCFELYFDFAKVAKCKHVIWILRNWDLHPAFYGKCLRCVTVSVGTEGR